jgi:hypothetical protein
MHSSSTVSSTTRAAASVTAALLTALYVCVLPARAQVTVYNSEASFDAALGSKTVVNFDSAPDGYNVVGFDDTVFFGGVGVDGTAGASQIATVTPDVASYYNFGTGEPELNLQDGIPNDDVTFVLPTGTTAFGLEFGDNKATTFSFDVDFVGGGTFGPTVETGGLARSATTTPGFAFVGFMSSGPAIADLAVTFPQGDDIPSFDDLTYSPSAIAPEPGGLALIGAACVAFLMPANAVLRRRRGRILAR